MIRRSLFNGCQVVFWASSVLAIACSTRSPGPGGGLTAPSVLPSHSASPMSQGSPQHGIVLTPVVGTGTGIVNDSASANDGEFTLRGQVNIDVHDAPPDTLLYIQIAADVGLPGAPEGEQTNGICQRAAAGLFAPLASFPGGPPATLQTSPGGAGAAHTSAGINNPFLPNGAKTDLVIRLIDVLPPGKPTVELRTPCYVFEVK
jgi:hypothetical protein